MDSARRIGRLLSPCVPIAAKDSVLFRGLVLRIKREGMAYWLQSKTSTADYRQHVLFEHDDQLPKYPRLRIDRLDLQLPVRLKSTDL